MNKVAKKIKNKKKCAEKPQLPSNSGGRGDTYNQCSCCNHNPQSTQCGPSGLA